jgi:hypothetical protein
MTQIARNERTASALTTPPPERVLSKNAETRLASFYSGAKFTVAGALCGLVIVLAYEKINGIPDLPRVENLAMMIGAVTVLCITRYFRVR